MEPADLPAAVQQTLQARYRISLSHAVDSFVSYDREIYTALDGRADIPNELLLLREEDGDMDIGLFLDESMLARAHPALQRDQWHRQDIEDITSVIEGVSHLICVLWHADQRRELRPVDMELQAEIDKFVILKHFCQSNASLTHCQRLLFDVGAADSDPELAERYTRARRYAWTYCQWLQARFTVDEDGLQRELATFYRRSGHAKQRHICEVH